MAFPYSDDANDGPPAGAIRAMLRNPASSATPLPIPRRQPSAFQQPTARFEQPPAQYDMPTPNWKTDTTWGDLTKQALNVAAGFGERPKGIGNLDDALEAIRKQHADFYEKLGKLNSGASKYDTTPADYDTYRRGVRGSESDGNDNAVNTEGGTNATGRYQFLPSTAQSLIPDLDLTTLKNPDVQEKLMKLYTDKSVATLEPLLGRKPTMGELYMLHFLGHAGGPKVLQNLDAPIEETVGAAERAANKAFIAPYKTGRQLLAGLSAKFGR